MIVAHVVEFHHDQDLFDHLAKLPLSGVVAVDGFDGAGKTTLARKISRHFSLPLLDTDSLLAGPEVLNYVDRIDYERLRAAINSNESGLIASGVFIQYILRKVEIVPSIKIYVKLISSNGLWHQGWNIDSEFYDENQTLDGTMRLHSALSVDLVRYHRNVMPHVNSDLCYVRTEA
jgi:hypothetical protein